MASLLALRRPPALVRLGPSLAAAAVVAPGRRGIFDYQPVKPLGDRIDEPKSYPGGKKPNPQLFGYPELPTEYMHHRDPRGGWWDRQERRNFGETLQVNHDALNVWAPEHPKTVSWRAGAYFLGGLFSVVYGVYLANKTFYPYPDVVFREYPNDGQRVALGGSKRERYPVFRGIDPADEFEGSQKEYYEGPGRKKDRYY